MIHFWRIVFSTIMFGVAIARAEAAPSRPDVNTDKPLAKCKLLAVNESPSAKSMQAPANVYSVPTPVDDPLANYERTELGNWRMPGDAELSDPWIRLLVVGPKRPLVVDVAVFVEGKSFRQAREAWIDDLLASPVSTSNTKQAPEASKSAPGNKSVESEGTEAKDAASNASAAVEKQKQAKEKEPEDEQADGEKTKAADEAKEDDEAEKKTPGVATQSRQMPMIRERLANYLAASGAEVDRDEIGWLVAEWGSGPGLVVLDPAHSWQRASVAMLEAFMDGDGDGVLSAQEIAGADEAMRRADLDANEVVDVSELRLTNRREVAVPFKMGNSLVVILDSNTDWDSLATILASVYSSTSNASPTANPNATVKERIASGDSELTSDALRGLIDEPADVSLRVDFGGGKDTAGGVSLVAASSEFTNAKDAVSATENVITINVGSDYLEISAAGSSAKSDSSISDSQIAVGAVIDGNPLLRILDQDQDQRLTLRERQELKGLLNSLDRDSDGKLAAAEVPIPIRLAITLGPHVHELLAKPSGAARAIAPQGDPAPPDWFASMDKNSDRDLSREEFLGTTEQFKQFDADGDGLLNVAEALKLNGGK